MKSSSNIENLVIYRDRKLYGFTVQYKSGKRFGRITGEMLIVPDKIHDFMKNAPYSVSHDDTALDYHETVYYSHDIRTCSVPD